MLAIRDDTNRAMSATRLLAHTSMAYEHSLSESLRAAIGGYTDPDDVVDAVLRCLDAHAVVTYRGDDVPLLAPHGRLLFDLAGHPDSSLQEAAFRIGTTESTIAKQMTRLVTTGLLERTRSTGRNRYRLRVAETLSHPDVRLMLEALITAAGMAAQPSSDSTQISDQ